MHKDQLTIMFVGSPNTRTDFHLEEGQFCGTKNCSKLLWDAVGVADQPNYWEACECSRSLFVCFRSLKKRLHTARRRVRRRCMWTPSTADPSRAVRPQSR